MQKDMTRRKNIIKNSIIVFLVLMLVLTFFSNTILNYSLAEVAVVYPMYGTISTRIRGQGTVNANQTQHLYIEDTRVIKEVYVYRGTYVEKGAIIYTLEDGASDELVNAKNTLTTMEINYKRAKLESKTDFTDILNEIEQLKKDLGEAELIKANLSVNRLMLEKILNSINETEVYKNKLVSDKAALETKLSNLDPDTKMDEQQFKDELNLREAEYNNIKSKTDLQTASLKELEKELLSIENPLLMTKYYLDLKVKEKTDYTDIHGSVAPATWVYLADLDARISSEGDAVEKAKLQKEYNEKFNALIQWEDVIAVEINEFDKEITKLTTEYNNVKLQYDGIVIRKEQLINDNAVQQYLLDEIGVLYFPLRDRRDKTVYQEQLAAIVASISNAEAELTSLNKQKQELDKKVMTENEAYELVTEALDKLNEAYKRHETQKEKAELDDAITQMNLDNMKRDIELQQAVVKKLEKKVYNASVVAPVSGTISSLNYVAGQKTVAGEVAASIEISEKGYTMSFTVTVEQSRRISVGQQAQVQYYYGSDTPIATVLSIKVDYSAPQTNRIIEIEIKGVNVYPGQTMNVTLGDSGRDFEAVVPNSAVHEDNKGKFVYIIEAKNTPIGNRYIARRTEVQVIASDDRQSAISGVSAYSSYVITTASKPLSDGAQVRLVEN